MKIVGIIPARYASTRFPGKSLAPIAGKPLILWVIEQCQKASSLAEIVVATDNEYIAEIASKQARVELTRGDHPSGTDRIAEVAARLECDGVVNIQGDEPLIQPTVIDQVAEALNESEMSTAATPIHSIEDYSDPNVVKVVLDRQSKALYFSRRSIPYLRDQADTPLTVQIEQFPFLKHLGIYAFRTKTLQKIVQLPVSELEKAERLEQLRAIDNGIGIKVVTVEYDSIGVDTPEDVAKVEKLLAQSK